MRLNMTPLHFTIVDTASGVSKAPTVKPHQAIGILNGRNCQIYINSSTGTAEENLLLQRVIEATSRDPSLVGDKINQIKVKQLANGSFEVKIDCQSALSYNIKLEKTMDDVDNELQNQLLPFAELAYDFYKNKLPNVKENLERLFSSLGTIQVRAKSPTSAANRLMRTLKFTWGPKEGINNRDEAVKNLWDAIGSRVIVNKGSESEMQKVVDVMCDAIRNGQLEVTHLNNLRGVSGRPYFTDTQIDQLRQADAEKIMKMKKAGFTDPTPIPIQIGNSERKGGSPFTSICAYIKHGDGVIGEFQVIGPEVLKLANAEHLPYDAMINKDLYRELNDAGKKQMEPFFGPFLTEIKHLTTDQKKEYNEYLNQAYIQARKVESGEAVPTDQVPLPTGFAKELSVENILHISEKYEETKKTMKKIF
jgi:hypothetical protein